MKLAFISDTHFGDGSGVLVDEVAGAFRRTKEYVKFLEAAGTNNDYLVLLGDILDFSIEEYAKVYHVAGAFFRFLKEDNIARSIIYVPGNHDYTMWNTVEYQTRVIHPLQKGYPANHFRWSAPGVIDDRGTAGNGRGFSLPGIIDRVIDPDERPQESMFLNYLTINRDGSGDETRFYFAYPNLYMVTDSESVLLTHGHYLEPFWTLTGEWAMKIAGKDLEIDPAFDLKTLVALNQPLCQLACTGIGQAGPLTRLVRDMQQEIKSGQTFRVKKYINRLEKEMERLLAYRFYDPRMWLFNIFTSIVKKRIFKALDNYRATRYNEAFLLEKEIRQRFCDFYYASLEELDKLRNSHDVDIPRPKKVIFGHTHCAVPWSSKNALRIPVAKSDTITLYNTGGWLRHREKGQADILFTGAEVFTYETTRGFSSQKVS